MISERTLATSFASLWTEAVPLLTPAFVRTFTATYRQVIVPAPFPEISEIGPEPVEKFDLVSELAFSIAETALRKGCGAVELSKGEAEIDTLTALAAARLGYHTINPLSLNSTERSESIWLAHRYESFFKYLSTDSAEIEFRPVVPGYGFLDSREADLAVGDTLYEVKTVSRNLSGSDIRQLLIYLALSNGRWSYAGFFNPRRMHHYRVNVVELLSMISGGHSSHDAFDSIRRFLMHRDLQEESQF